MAGTALGTDPPSVRPADDAVRLAAVTEPLS